MGGHDGILEAAGGLLIGLRPVPAFAALGLDGSGGAWVLIALLAGVAALPLIRKRLFPVAHHQPARSNMDIRALTPTYAVSPQIDLSDLAAIKAAGFTTIIDNRPDSEISAHLHTPHMRAAAEALGLTFVANPVIGGALTMENVRTQAAAVTAATGPVFAYCASGNRCSVVWALMSAGSRPTDELIGIPAQYGYNLEHLRAQIDALAATAKADKA